MFVCQISDAHLSLSRKRACEFQLKQLIHERLKFHKCFHKLGCTSEMFDQEDSTSQNPNQKIDEANDILGQWNFSGSASF